jgi:DNA-binding transcriptional ArsR family regulator
MPMPQPALPPAIILPRRILVRRMPLLKVTFIRFGGDSRHCEPSGRPVTIFTICIRFSEYKDEAMNDPLEAEIQQLHEGVCSALADPTRIQILYLLSHGPSNVTDLAEQLSVPQSTASRHLRVLRERDLVTTERDGTSVIYDLCDKRMIDALDLMREIMRDVAERRATIHLKSTS